jgi:hypothetical protein
VRLTIGAGGGLEHPASTRATTRVAPHKRVNGNLDLNAMQVRSDRMKENCAQLRLMGQ